MEAEFDWTWRGATAWAWVIRSPRVVSGKWRNALAAGPRPGLYIDAHEPSTCEHNDFNSKCFVLFFLVCPQSKVDLLPYQDKIVQGKQQRWKHDIYNLLAQSWWVYAWYLGSERFTNFWSIRSNDDLYLNSQSFMQIRSTDRTFCGDIQNASFLWFWVCREHSCRRKRWGDACNAIRGFERDQLLRCASKAVLASFRVYALLRLKRTTAFLVWRHLIWIFVW